MNAREIEAGLFVNLGFTVIIGNDPERSGTVRVFSSCTNEERQRLDDGLGHVLPAFVRVIHNDPNSLLSDFIENGRDFEKVVKIARMWRLVAVTVTCLLIIEQIWKAVT